MIKDLEGELEAKKVKILNKKNKIEDLELRLTDMEQQQQKNDQRVRQTRAGEEIKGLDKKHNDWRGTKTSGRENDDWNRHIWTGEEIKGSKLA